MLAYPSQQVYRLSVCRCNTGLIIGEVFFTLFRFKSITNVNRLTHVGVSNCMVFKQFCFVCNEIENIILSLIICKFCCIRTYEAVNQIACPLCHCNLLFRIGDVSATSTVLDLFSLVYCLYDVPPYTRIHHSCATLPTACCGMVHNSITRTS